MTKKIRCKGCGTWFEGYYCPTCNELADITTKKPYACKCCGIKLERSNKLYCDLCWNDHHKYLVKIQTLKARVRRLEAL
jgi:hypothetical protein